MVTTFNIHMDPGEESFVVFWADTTDVPGLTVIADDLPQLRRLIDEAAAIHLPGMRSPICSRGTSRRRPSAGPSRSFRADRGQRSHQSQLSCRNTGTRRPGPGPLPR